MGDLVKLARGTYSKDRLFAHWRGCEEMHSDCLILKMADEIERLRNEHFLLQAREDFLKTILADDLKMVNELERLRKEHLVLRVATQHLLQARDDGSCTEGAMDRIQNLIDKRGE